VRVFLDTNVLVSAFATRGLCESVFELVLIEHEFVTGHTVLKELHSTLRSKVKVPDARCAEIIEYVSGEAELVVQSASPAVCDADDDDRLVLGEAIAGRADVFVTGDAAIVSFGTVGGMRVLTPRQLWEALRGR
jgi:uncharacterized protein